MWPFVTIYKIFADFWGWEDQVQEILMNGDLLADNQCVPIIQILITVSYTHLYMAANPWNSNKRWRTMLFYPWGPVVLSWLCFVFIGFVWGRRQGRKEGCLLYTSTDSSFCQTSTYLVPARRTYYLVGPWWILRSRSVDGPNCEYSRRKTLGEPRIAN